MNPPDAKLEIILREPEAAIGDDGFTERVMHGLPRKRVGSAKARRLTLGAAAATGSFVASLLSAPVESAFSSYVLEGGYQLALVATLFVAGVLAIPLAWVFYSK